MKKILFSALMIAVMNLSSCMDLESNRIKHQIRYGEDTSTPESNDTNTPRRIWDDSWVGSYGMEDTKSEEIDRFNENLANAVKQLKELKKTDPEIYEKTHIMINVVSMDRHNPRLVRTWKGVTTNY